MTPLLSVKNLKTSFLLEDGIGRAVDDITFHIDEGEILGLVGESGCGKSVTSLSILRLVAPPGRITGGEIWFKGTDLLKLPESAMQKVRGNEISMIFQEPMTSLNPVFTVGDQVAEAIVLHQRVSKKEAMRRAVERLHEVQISDPERRAKDYPHQLSGGMRQRVMIAMALSCNPSLVIADEPTTALDVTIQAQILEILKGLQRTRNLSVLLITHDLGVIAEVADRVAVMYTGKIVEEAEVRSIYKTPKHPYTRGLLNSIPNIDRELRAQGGRHRLATISGVVPDLLKLPRGCAFEERCGEARKPELPCKQAVPDLYRIGERHTARCYLYQ